MEKTRQLRCFECGGTMAPVARAGRLYPYRGTERFEVPADLEILTCGSCGVEAADEDVIAYLDEVFEKQYVKRRQVAPYRSVTFALVQRERRAQAVVPRLKYSHSQNADFSQRHNHWGSQ